MIPFRSSSEVEELNRILEVILSKSCRQYSPFIPIYEHLPMFLIISVQVERQLVLRTQENYRILKERSVQLKGENKELRRRVERVRKGLETLIM